MTKPSYIDPIRSDISKWLVHCTQDTSERTSFDNLRKILSDCYLEGSKNLIKAGTKCVCFSEAPITKIKSLISYCDAFQSSLRYAPFGIAVRKEWLFSQGGRPVIYQQDAQFENTSKEHKYLHVKYEPDQDFDFSWEREWRIKCNRLRLQPEMTTVFVKDRQHLNILLNEHYSGQSSWTLTGTPFSIEIYPWGLISLDEIS